MFLFAANANAGGIGKAAGEMFNKAKSAVTSAIDTGASLVKNVASKVVDKGAQFAQDALKQAGGLVTGTLNKIGDAAKNLTGKAKDWLIGKGMELANKLPGPFGQWAKQGVQFGAGALTSLQGKLNHVIDKGIDWAKGAAAAGLKLGSAQINKLRSLFKHRINLGVDHVKRVLHGKVNYVAGAVTQAMAKAPQKISQFLSGFLGKVRS
jgi:hypothetical protein